jgi:hypothetical protein
MIGPTGVGKTEIARRLARLADAPFIKVEATKFTEVGYVGKDVDTIVRDLVDVAVKQERERQVRTPARAAPRTPPRSASSTCWCRRRAHDGLWRLRRRRRRRQHRPPGDAQAPARGRAGRQGDRGRGGRTPPALEIMGPPGMEEMAEQLQGPVLADGPGAAQDPQAEGRRGAEAAGRRRGRQAGQRGRDPRRRAGQCRGQRHRLHRRDRQGRLAQRAQAAPTSAARACSATCCRWWRAPPSAPSTAWCAPTTSCSSPAAPSTWPSPAT